MRRALKYALAAIIPFLVIDIYWSVPDIQTYSGREPIGRWSGYHPGSWQNVAIVAAILGIVLVIALKTLGSQALVPALYGLVVGYYFYHMQTQLREPEDVELARLWWSALGLIPMGLADILAMVANWHAAHYRDESDSDGRPQSNRRNAARRVGLVLSMLAATSLALLAVRSYVRRAKFVDAAFFGDVERVTRFLSEGMSVNTTAAHGATPLLEASFTGHVHLARLLLEQGADVNACHTNGSSSLYWAALRGNTELAELLVAYQADVNLAAKGPATPLHAAARLGHTAIVQLLVEHGARLNVVSWENKTALDYALANGHLEVSRYLREHGAAYAVQRGPTGR